MSAVVVQCGDGRIRVEGELGFDTVADLVPVPWEKGGQGEIVVDLSGVRRADSAGLALLLEWARAARGEGRPIRFCDTPDQLKSLAHVTGVDSILHLD